MAQVYHAQDLEVESLEKTRPEVVRVLDYGTLDHDIGLQETIVGAIDLSHAPGAELRRGSRTGLRRSHDRPNHARLPYDFISPSYPYNPVVR